MLTLLFPFAFVNIFVSIPFSSLLFSLKRTKQCHRKINQLEESLTDIDSAAFAYCRGMLGSSVPTFVPNRRLWLETQSMKSTYREPHILTEQRSLTMNSMALEEMGRENFVKAVRLLNRIIDDNYKMGGKDMTNVDAK